MDVGSHALAGRYTRPREEDSAAKRIGRGLGAFARLLIPVLLLVTAAGAAFAYAGVPAPVLSQSWMNLGLLLLPLTFLAIHLTSRRYGAAYAFAQVLIAYGLVVALALFAQPYVTMALGQSHAALREIAGFGAALFVAHVVSIVVFDGLRGPQWWQAPLFASLIGGIVLCLIAFPASYAGTGIDWTGRMIDYMGVTSMAALLLVIPYWTLRGLVPPRSGFGGY
ncbi:MAG TPA: hypothetical protein VG867_04350 [Rhizomicrobium sp.]|nr:hypothetical protein [Rhizomicrobium sp.]